MQVAQANERQINEGERKLAEEMSGDFCALQNGLIPVHPFSSSSALGNAETSDAYTVKAEPQPQHHFL